MLLKRWLVPNYQLLLRRLQQHPPQRKLHANARTAAGENIAGKLNKTEFKNENPNWKYFIPWKKQKWSEKCELHQKNSVKTSKNKFWMKTVSTKIVNRNESTTYFIRTISFVLRFCYNWKKIYRDHDRSKEKVIQGRSKINLTLYYLWVNFFLALNYKLSRFLWNQNLSLPLFC